jgi:hypothetical protein
LGFNVGGIYVKVEGDRGQDAVHAAIRDYWLARGAKESKRDPLDFEPLGLAKTGKLGFIVAPAESSDGDDWVAVYDSERYTADAELAAHLAGRLSAEVWLYEITDAADEARAKLYGGYADELEGAGEVQQLVGRLPFAFLYFNKFKEEFSDEDRRRFRTLSFEAIPQRPGRAYSGRGKSRR